MIIDSHTHIGKLPGSKYSEDYRKNLDSILKEAKENKVDRLVVIAGFEEKDGFSISAKSLLKLAEGKKNVHVVAGIDINYGSEYLKQLENWLMNKKIVGIKFNTGYQHYYPYDERCKPVYKLCIKHDVPVIFHSGDTLAGYVPDPKVKYAHPIHIDEVATDFPELKIVIAHMGNPWLVDCAEVLYKNPNVYADISGLVVGEDLASPYGKLMKKRVMELIEYVGQEHKLLYGTDWPLCPMEPYIEFSKNLDLKGDSLEKLFSGNAVKVFKL